MGNNTTKSPSSRTRSSTGSESKSPKIPSSPQISPTTSSSSSSFSSNQSPSKKSSRKETNKTQKTFAKYIVPADEPDKPVETVDLEKMIRDMKCLKDVIKKDEDELWFQLILIWKLSQQVDQGGEELSDDYRSAGGALPSSHFLSGCLKLSLNSPDELGEHLLSIHKIFKQFDVANDVHKYRDFYRFCFGFGLEETGRKNLNTDVAIYLWKALVADRFPILGLWCEFLQIKGRAISRDTWNVFLDFVDLIRNNGEYDPDGAWPTLIDEFAEYSTTSLSRETLVGNCVQKISLLIRQGKLKKDSLKVLPNELQEMVNQLLKIQGLIST